MRRFFLVLFLCCIVNVSFGQFENKKLLGLWQTEKAEVTSMYLDTYNFLSNGRFIFKPNEYNGLNRIISIVGKYSISGDSLFLTPDSTKELIEGYLARSEITTMSDTWEIRNGKAKMIACKKKNKEIVIIKFLQNDNVILLDNEKYYKIKN